MIFVNRLNNRNSKTEQFEQIIRMYIGILIIYIHMKRNVSEIL
jgi:hypothetical protein